MSSCICVDSVTVSSCIRVAADGILFFSEAEQYCIAYVCRVFFIQSSLGGHLACLHVLATVNSAAVNRGVHVSF